MAYATLGSPLGVFPGTYRVKVNNTLTTVTAEPRATHPVGTGSIVVNGTTGEYFYVLDQNGEQLAYSTVSNPVSLLPGSYRVRVNNTYAPVTIEAGKPTELTAGTVLVAGTTGEYWYVDDAQGEQLGYATLGASMSYLPGSYSVRVNNVRAPITVVAGDTTLVPTGTVVREGPSGEYFYVLDQSGEQLAYGTTGTPVSMLAGSYRLRVGTDTTAVSVLAKP